MSKQLDLSILHNTEGTSDKVYIVQLAKHDDLNFSVRTYWGRRTANPYTTREMNFDNEAIARRFGEDILRKKVREGYRQIARNLEAEVTAKLARYVAMPNFIRAKKDKVEEFRMIEL